MRLSFNGPLCAHEKGLDQFQPGLPLLGKSTVTQLVTWCVHWPVAKTSESATKNKGSGGQPQPSPPSWKHTYMNGHHGRSYAYKSAALNAEGNLDSAERSSAKLKSGQISKEKEEKHKCHSKAEAGGIFSVNRGCILQRSQSRLKKKKFSWESRLQTEAISRHYKVLVQLSLWTAGWILVHMVLPKRVVCVCAFFCAFGLVFTGILVVPWLHIPDTSNS